MEFKKYDKIKMLGHQENEGIFDEPEDIIVIEEKIDGGNFRFMIKDGNIIFGSRTQQLTSDEGEETNVAKDFKRCVDFVREQATETLNKDDLNNLSHLIFYGESCHKHTMSYDWDKIPPFLGFDVYDMKTNTYLSYIDKTPIFLHLGLPTVPLIGSSKVKNLVPYNDQNIPKSAYPSVSAKNQQAEGIVYKNYSKQLFAKHVRAEFKEEARDTFGGSVKYEETDDGKLVARWCTNPRIDKIIFKFIDDGHKLDMPMMAVLPKEVYKDIMEENWQEIVMSRMKLDFNHIRKLINKRCLSVLKQCIVNTGLNKK